MVVETSPRPPDAHPTTMSLRRRTEIQISDPNGNMVDLNNSQDINKQSLDIDSNLDEDAHRPVTQQLARGAPGAARKRVSKKGPSNL